MKLQKLYGAGLSTLDLVSPNDNNLYKCNVVPQLKSTGLI